MGGPGSGNPNAKLPNGGGRPKDCKNKFTELKNEILESYKQRGGVKWLNNLPDNVFFGSIRDLLPKKVETEHSGEVGLTINIIKSGEGKNAN
jgi:hypothetical protein